MNRFFTITLQSLLLVALTFMVAAGQEEEIEEKYSIWIGSSYTDFTDYSKKIGEYRNGDDEFLPEFDVDYLSRGENHIFFLNGKYRDQNNIVADMASKIGDGFSADFKYRSMYKQAGQDMLANLETREAGGGKIMTHEILDPDASYYVHRKEIESGLNIRLSKKNNVRLIAAHRTVLQTGDEQRLASNHCFSCHITSSTATIDKITHQIMAGLQAEIGKSTVGYQFGYRIFESEAPVNYASFDRARHPINGQKGAEFGSRLSYNGVSLPVGEYPNTEKLSHKLSFKGNAGNSSYGSSIGFSKATNRNNELASNAFSGSAFYATSLAKLTRLIAKFSLAKLDVDDIFVDLPSYREGRPGTPQDFDFTRKSSLNRVDLRGSVEVISRLNEKITASFTAGMQSIDRDYYPAENADATTTIFGQAKVRYRKGLRYSTSFKYRFESTSNPFTSARGIFEARGRDLLNPVDGTAFVHYWQREDLRYQDITTAPTQAHILDLTSNWRPNNKVNLNFGFKAKYDKNADLDSLDINHFSMQPSLALNVNVDQNWAMSFGGSYGYNKMRGPVAIALFDG